MIRTIRPLDRPDPGLERVAKANGFSLHAGVSCEGHERNKRERLCRYILAIFSGSAIEILKENCSLHPVCLSYTLKFLNKWGRIIASSTRFCMVPGVKYDGRLAWSVGYTGHGVGASRFGARIGIELLGYAPTDIIKMKFVTKTALPWVPEPLCWPGVRLTQLALVKADRNGGKRGLWLKFLDMLGSGFTC